MSVFQDYLDAHDVTRYQVSKASGVGQTTLQRASASKSGTNGISGRILKATALTVNKTPGQALDEMIELENNK